MGYMWSICCPSCFISNICQQQFRWNSCHAWDRLKNSLTFPLRDRIDKKSTSVETMTWCLRHVALLSHSELNFAICLHGKQWSTRIWSQLCLFCWRDIVCFHVVVHFMEISIDMCKYACLLSEWLSQYGNALLYTFNTKTSMFICETT